MAHTPRIVNARLDADLSSRVAALFPPAHGVQGTPTPECPRCGGTLRFIATITEESAITKILDSLGLASSPPLRRARAPDPQLDFDPEQR
jgi:hypothetical protein